MGGILGANGRLLCSFMPENALDPDERLGGDRPSGEGLGRGNIGGSVANGSEPILALR